MSITLTSLLADCRIQLSDAQCQSSFWTDADLTLYINNALLTLFGLLPSDALRDYEKLDETNIVSGTVNYDLPSDFYLEYSIYYNGILCRKIKYSEQYVIDGNTYFKTLANQPGYSINNDDIYLHPSPEHDAASGLKVYYLAKPPVLVSGSDTVNLDAAYSPIIVKLACGNAISLKRSVEEGKVMIQSALDDLKVLKMVDVVSEAPSE